jgi:hypothetical protein
VDGERVAVGVIGSEAAQEVLRLTLDGGGVVAAVHPHRESLESFFVRDAPADQDSTARDNDGSTATTTR